MAIFFRKTNPVRKLLKHWGNPEDNETWTALYKRHAVVVDGIAEDYKYLFRRMLGSLLVFVSGAPDQLTIDEQRKRFDEAMERYGLDDEGLVAYEKGLRRNRMLISILAAVPLGYTVWNAMYGSLTAFLICIVLLIVMAVTALRISLDIWRVTQRRFGSITEFLRS